MISKGTFRYITAIGSALWFVTLVTPGALAAPAQPPSAAPAAATPLPAQPAPISIPAAPPALPMPITVPPPTNKQPTLPFPNLPSVRLDDFDNVGIAQSLARARGLQGRVLWIDATANIDRYNSSAKIATLTAQIKAAGFNTIVFDVKPIIGFTVYPSRYAPKLTDWVRPWKTQTLPSEYDPLKDMVADAHAQGLSLLVNFNAFSEGHREFLKGPGYDHQNWQTVLYEMDIRVHRDASGTPSYPVTDRGNTNPRTPDDLSLYTDLTTIPKASAGSQEGLISILDSAGNVLLLTTPTAVRTLGLKLPPGGAALAGNSPASTSFLRFNALPGFRLAMDATPAFVPISKRPDRQVPLMTNPNNPEVRQRLLDMLTEVTTNYAIDGVIFDDRLRYAALNCDFSDTSRRLFEQYLASGSAAAGAVANPPNVSVRWPDDIFRYAVSFPSLDRTVVRGQYYDAWLTFRALTLRNFVADAVRTVKTVRPTAVVGTYVGSWYPDYPDLGANWAADDLDAGFHFLNDSYRKTGWAGLVDFVITGCYYGTATISEAQSENIAVGETVEAAGQFSNRAVNDQAFVYAGIGLDQFKGKPDALKRVLQAAAATTQGIMCFDLSHDIEPLWPIFTEAFGPVPAQAPHQIPGLADQLRSQHLAQRAAGVVAPAVVLYRGASGTGF